MKINTQIQEAREKESERGRNRNGEKKRKWGGRKKRHGSSRATSDDIQREFKDVSANFPAIFFNFFSVTRSYMHLYTFKDGYI